MSNRKPGAAAIFSCVVGQVDAAPVQARIESNSAHPAVPASNLQDSLGNADSLDCFDDCRMVLCIQAADRFRIDGPGSVGDVSTRGVLALVCFLELKACRHGIELQGSATHAAAIVESFYGAEQIHMLRSACKARGSRRFRRTRIRHTRPCLRPSSEKCTSVCAHTADFTPDSGVDAMLKMVNRIWSCFRDRLA